ncbi:DNA polymerase B [Anoxybacteroides amylolyticum]|uniref:DNA polymerase type B, organellar and viral family protein n=1 Tax=Anoxybacteroides amylolyticum TaxID=294699 RepID=A0A160F6E7_9BACL|nr:DNA polymerase B [Anoxybacillus amylolyticus]ANB62177.1 DNA polymerase type B, organellar and viral family protein [Anoxybacillus amylolyticus]
MFTFYDIEVFRYDWMVVLVNEGHVIRIHNDTDKLRNSLSTSSIFVGYNNYAYDDIILAGLLTGKDPYELSQKLIRGEKVNATLGYLTLDAMQEINGVSLKEVQANMGLDIKETPIDFDINRPLTKEEVELVFQYCENDVRTTKKVFELREDYFTSKFEIVDAFKLPVTAVKKTKASLSASVLKTKPKKLPRDRLHLEFDQRLKRKELPREVIAFYENIKKRYIQGEDHDALEKEKLEIEIAGIKHTFGFGGVHGAIENFRHTGQMMQIDVSSYFPSLMINNQFISRQAESPELFTRIYEQRLALKKQNDRKHEIYKIVLNSAFGAMKSEYNPLFDPKQFNNVTMNGQLILTHLILLLEPFAKLIQSNTDGIIIAYEDGMKDMILEIIRRFGEQYQLSLDVDDIHKIAQRDVNNYVVQYTDGTIKAKGRMSKYQGGDWERNSLHIVDKALVNFYMYNIPIPKTIIEAWKNNQLDLFQVIAKAGKFDGMAHEVEGKMVPLQKVNRIFATNQIHYGGVYKVRDHKYYKVPNTSERSFVWNGEISEMNKKLIDINYYIKLVQSNVF